MKYLSTPSERIELVIENSDKERLILWRAATKRLMRHRDSRGDLDEASKNTLSNLQSETDLDNEVAEPKLYPTFEQLGLIANCVAQINRRDFLDTDLLKMANTMAQEMRIEHQVALGVASLDDDLSNL